MATVITVMNMKGGVGKTTVAVHIAGLLGRFGLQKKYRKVLAIDYDPQFNLSQALLPAKTYFSLEKDRKTTLSVLVDDDKNLNPYQLQVSGNHNPPKVKDVVTPIYTIKDRGCLDVLPSTLDLMYVALGQATTNMASLEERFDKFIHDARGTYDTIIIDCHPAGSLFTKTSLRNSDHVLIPVVPQRYAVRGIGLMMNFIDAKKVGDKSPTPHILFNATSRVGTSPEEVHIRNDPKFSNFCIKATLKKFKAFTEPEEGRGFCWGSKKPYSTTALANLLQVTNELLDRTGA